MERKFPTAHECFARGRRFIQFAMLPLLIHLEFICTLFVSTMHKSEILSFYLLRDMREQRKNTGWDELEKGGKKPGTFALCALFLLLFSYSINYGEKKKNTHLQQHERKRNMCIIEAHKREHILALLPLPFSQGQRCSARIEFVRDKVFLSTVTGFQCARWLIQFYYMLKSGAKILLISIRTPSIEVCVCV